LKISTNISINDWTAFINEHRSGTIFQSPEIFDFFRKVRRVEPLVLAAYDDEEKLCGVLMGIFTCEKEGIGKLLSSRMVIYGGPLLTGDEDQKRSCLDAILKELVHQTKGKALFTQFRNYFSWEEYLDVFERYGFTFLDRLNYIVRLPETGDRRPVTGNRLPDMSESRRRQIRKGLSGGAEIIKPANIEQLKEFYNILFKLYRYKIKKPLADWSFFENFYKQTSPRPPSPVPHPPIGIIRLIRFEGKIIGGILAPVFKDKCIYEWYICGLDKEYKDQYPSVLATWAAIEYALNNNLNCFDFMGVGKPDVLYGVRDFKARFGGELVNYGRITRINNPLLYNFAELGFNVLALFKKI